MGRRKKKATASLSDQNIEETSLHDNNTTASSLLSLEFLDLLVSLFGLAGFYHDAEDSNNTTTGNNSRRLLVSSLENLSIHLVKLQQQEEHVSLQSGDDPLPVSNNNIIIIINSSANIVNNALLLDSILLQLEEQLVRVRTQVNVFLDAVASDRVETIRVKREVETLAAVAAAVGNGGSSSCQVLISWSLFATRLAAAILSESHVEERIVRNLQQSLDSFYSSSSLILAHDRGENNKSNSGGAGGDILTIIRHAVGCLNRETRGSKLVDSLVYEEAAAILSKLITQNDKISITTTSTAADSSWTRLSYSTNIAITMPSSTATLSKTPSEAVDPMRRRLLDKTCATTTTTLTPLDVLRDFCAPFSSSNRSNNDNNNDMRVLPTSFCSSTTFLLLVGLEGSGKTFTCDEMERFASAVEIVHLHVIRPCLPMDFLGRRVGETEDAILSLYGAIKACSRSGPTLVLLDNIDYLCVNNNNNNHVGDDDDDDANSRRLGNQHLVVRTQATFKEVMELLRHDNERQFHSPPPSPVATTFPVLILGTARRNVDDSASALFDRIFFLESPNELQRRHMIMQYLGIRVADSSLENNDMNDTVYEETEETDRLLLSLSQATIGKSYSELAQCCRQAIHQAALLAPSPSLQVSRDEESDHQQHGQQPSIFTVLRILQEQLHRKTPESLRSALIHDVVNMCVWTAQDLQSNNKSSSDNTPSSGACSTFGLETTEMDEFNLGLYGPSIEAAWKELQHSIVIPLCQRRALSELLDCHGTTCPKVLAGGLVLAGVPGTGKSAIAFETARYAAQLLPSIKLLDVSCTSLIHKEVGGSERAIHQLFVAVRKATPCILLLDGIDNIAAVRGNDATTEGTMDRVLSTLLVELDGVDDDEDAPGSGDLNHGIAVIGIAHNINLIDPALLRPGRLAKVVELELPDKDTRQRIVQRELERIKTPYVIVDDNDDDDDDYGSNQDEYDITDTTTGTAAATSLIVHATTGMAASSVVAICHDLKLWLARNTSDGGLNNNNHEVDDNAKIQIRRETIESLIRSRK